MFFLFWDTDVFYNNNIDPTLSRFTSMRYSTTTPINNKIAWINSSFQHTSTAAEYSDSVTNGVTVF